MTTTQVPLWLVDEIRVWIERRKTGSLEINFFQGGVSNMNRRESVKPKDAHAVTA